MPNVKLVFYGTKKSETETNELTCYANDTDDIFIDIEMPGCYSSYVCLDKPTAIKLHRELKKQISFLTD